MVFQQLGRQPNRIRRRHRAVRPHFQRQLVVVGDLPQTGCFHRVVHLAHRRVHRVDGNKTQPQVLVKILVRRNVAASLLQAQLHIDLAAFADRRNVNVLLQNLDVAIGFNHPAGDHSRLVRAQINHLRRISSQFERNLLQVQNDVGRILHHAGDRLELVQHAFNLHRRDRSSLNRGKQHPPQRVSNRRAESALKRLRPEVTVLVSQRFRIHRQALRLLKSLPEHSFLLFLRPFGTADSFVRRRIWSEIG